MTQNEIISMARESGLMACVDLESDSSSTPSVKPDLAKIRITSANGVTGMILSLHDGEGTVVFRVYDAEHNFTDYLLNHSDLRVTIQDEDAFFYQSKDPERASLDHSPATLGIDVLEAKGNHAAP